MGRCSEYVQKEYGFPTETIWGIVVLNAVAAVVVLPNDPNRLSWTIINVGAAVAYVGWDTAVAAANGINLAAAGGGAAGSNARDDGERPTYEVYGLGAGATVLYIVQTRAVG